MGPTDNLLTLMLLLHSNCWLVQFIPEDIFLSPCFTSYGTPIILLMAVADGGFCFVSFSSLFPL